MTYRPWTTSEVALLRQEYPREWAKDIAARLGRPVACVVWKARKLGLTRHHEADTGPKFAAYLRAKHAAGWSDAEIARGWKCGINTVNRHRRGMGLPANRYNANHRRKLAKATRQECWRHLARNLADLRHQRERMAAHRAGWPIGTSMGQARILEVLSLRPRTQAELVAAGVCIGPLPGMVRAGWIRATHRVGRRRVYALAIQRRHIATEAA